MKKTEQKNIIAELEARIAADLKPVDREAAFNDMLDECYSFDSVGGPFAHMSPSRVLLECDPTAHRCGVNDYADGMDWTEVGTETYLDEELDEIKEALRDEIQDEADRIAGEIEELESEDEPDADEIADKDAEHKELLRQLAELDKHSF